MPRGGYRPGAGRPKGSSKSAKREATVEAAARGVTPLDYMLSVVADEEAPADRRDKMAIAAAPYVHPKAEAKGGGGKKAARAEEAGKIASGDAGEWGDDLRWAH